MFRGYTLWMKLHPINGKFPMLNTLNDTVIAARRHFQNFWHSTRINGQGMVTGGRERRGDATKDTPVCMFDVAHLPMHGFWCPDYGRAEPLRDALVPKADP